MKAVDISQNVKVILSQTNNNGAIATHQGTIASSEVRKSASGGQFSVLVLFDGDRAPRWVSGGRLQRVSF